MKLKAIANEITAADLASVLGVRWWSYQLQFPQPVRGVTVRLCELRRQEDGSWKKENLSGGNGFEGVKDLREVAVKVLIHDLPGPYDCMVSFGATVARFKLDSRPNFSKTYSQPRDPKFIEGCLVFAIEEREANTSTGRLENMVRIIGLEIETK